MGKNSNRQHKLTDGNPNVRNLVTYFGGVG